MSNRWNKYNKRIAILFIILIVLVAGLVCLVIFDKNAQIKTAESTTVSEDSSESESGTSKDNTQINPSSSLENSDSGSETTVKPQISSEEQQVNKLIASMSLEQEVYQMFITTPEQITGVKTVTSAGDQTKSALTKHPVGGLIYFAGNLVSSDQTKSMLSNTKQYASEIEGITPFLCVDEEGGTVTRVASSSAFGVKNVGNMCDVSTADVAYSDGNYIGHYLANLGFNVDFAPDADVLTNNTSIVAKRSFGSDPVKVTDLASAYSNGLHASGILSTFEHFPGHGGVGTDTHDTLASTSKSFDEMMDAEFLPFQKAKENNVDFVMVTHIACPNITGDNTPASLSSIMITDMLKNQLGYDGIIITDSFQMGAITDSYNSSDAAVKAISAGVDIVLMPDDLNRAVNGVISSVNSGVISKDRIDESVRKILMKKVLMEEGKI